MKFCANEITATRKCFTSAYKLIVFCFLLPDEVGKINTYYALCWMVAVILTVVQISFRSGIQRAIEEVPGGRLPTDRRARSPLRQFGRTLPSPSIIPFFANSCSHYYRLAWASVENFLTCWAAREPTEVPTIAPISLCLYSTRLVLVFCDYKTFPCIVFQRPFDYQRLPSVLYQLQGDHGVFGISETRWTVHWIWKGIGRS
jgi:hypothetical protein